MRFYVNVDHVATVRQARRTFEPDPVEAARLCEKAGADGITIHLREDRRHIQDSDVRKMAGAITSVLNLELATAPDIIDLAAELKPHQATFVPERREEITTEGGLDLGAGAASIRRLENAVGKLKDLGIRVSLFIDPDPMSITRSREIGAEAIELHTGEYANRFEASGDAGEALERLREAAAFAAQCGLAVHAGHGLTYVNVTPVAAIPEIEELNIGHSVISRSIMCGIEKAVSDMRKLIDGAR